MKKGTRGFTLIELLVVISIIALLIGILLPAIGKARDSALVTQSLSNLRNFGVAHATYSSEWNGRQWTTSPDDLTQILGGGAYRNTYPTSGSTGAGRDWSEIPSVPLGFDKNGLHHSTRVGWAIQPMWWVGNCSIGSFRTFHTKPFNTYINSKVYDPIFWAPKDYTVNERIHQWMDDPGEWPVDQSGTLTVLLSSYCTSVAAQVSPDVYRGARQGGAQLARRLPAGHRSPNLSSATYPELKSHMVEHRWLQNEPSPNIDGAPGVPWFYNMGPDSAPGTLFFDGHIRLMSTREAVASSRRVVNQGGQKLDADDRGCFGRSGYFLNYAYNGAFNEINSWHVFTRDGIRGRDTTGG